MCVSTSVMQLFSLLLVVSAVFSAPVDKAAPVVAEAPERLVNPPAQEVAHEDADLQDLLSLVNKQARQNDVMVHKEKVSHFENNNGETVRVNQEEEKVVDTNTGDVIADVQQEVKQQAAEGQQEPETVVETKVNIPAEGVHETFVQDDAENIVGDVNIRGQEDALPSDEDVAMEPELTPADMAGYLYATQQFDAFYAALDRLVNQSKMTVGDASSYAKAVAVEYERLQLQDLEDRLVFEEGPLGQLAAAEEAYGPGQAGPYGGEESYPPADYQRLMAGYLPPEEEDFLLQSAPRGYVAPPPMEAADLDPYEFLAALWTEAYGKGNEEAQELVRMLYNRVSQDANPDDMAQIRDILMETVEASVNESPFNFDPEMLELEMPSQQMGYQEPELPEELLNAELEEAPSAQKKDNNEAQEEEEEEDEDEEEEGDAQSQEAEEDSEAQQGAEENGGEEEEEENKAEEEDKASEEEDKDETSADTKDETQKQ